MKYRGARAAVPWLADAMVAALSGFSAGDPPAVVTWAPTSRARRRQRGFDPAELLARAVARRLRLRCVGMLDRLPGPPQTGRSGADRRGGPRYVTRPGRRGRHGQRGRRGVPAAVVLVDDVTTTGATLAAAASALRDGGARVVVALTAARTPPPTAPVPQTAVGARS
jgi:predicted amidophosphoribosyltransferase